MQRRTGQNGSIEKTGNWYYARWWIDVEGQQKRKHDRARICPASGPGKLSASERQRKKRELIEQSGANSEQHFNRVVLGAVTFREQAQIFLRETAVRDTSTMNTAFNKWIFPAVGDLPLTAVDNLTAKPLVARMAESLAPKTVDTYFDFLKQVVASLVDGRTAKPIHDVNWSAKLLGLPKLDKTAQRRPSIESDHVSQLIAAAVPPSGQYSFSSRERQEHVLYAFDAATGLRVSELLAADRKFFINDWRTYQVRQQVDRKQPIITDILKTPYSYRDIDLHPDIAEFLKRYMGDREGLLFPTRNNTPHMPRNIEEDWLTPRLVAMGIDEPGMGCHIFKRHRQSWLRDHRCHSDIESFWMAHAPTNMNELYASIRIHVDRKKNVFKFGRSDKRLAEAAIVGYGFVLPKNPPKVTAAVPNVPRKSKAAFEALAVTA